MGHEKYVRDFLSAPHAISCIHEEERDGETGITILFNEGTAFWRPFEVEGESEEVWKTILAMRPRQLAEFDNVLFDPASVREVSFIAGDDGRPIMVISFKAHQFWNDLIFDPEEYENFEEGSIQLIELLSEYQHRRSTVWFINETAH
mgnify:CR=1 FL=1